MTLSALLTILIIGAVIGWLAGVIRQGFGFGLLGNIVIGILGAFIGQWIFARLGVFVGAGLLGQIFTGVIGALVLLFLIGLFRR